MRTALAALFLVLTATLVIIMASQGLGLLRDQILGPEMVVMRATPDVDVAAQDEQPVAELRDKREGKGFPVDVPEEVPTAAPMAPAPEGAGDVGMVTDGTTPRIVGGAGITPGPVTGGPLERIAPESKPAKPASLPAPIRWLAFPRVTITGAGLIDAGKRTIRLAWISPPEPDMMCRVTPEVAAEQPCARLALIAFRKRVRALGVECRLSPDDPADPATVPCRIGATDLGLWLVEQGWAGVEVGAPDDYRETELQARCAARGIWQDETRPDNCPQP